MDETEALEALATLLDTLAQNPYDISLHAQHISIAGRTGLEEQVQSAREMMTSFWPAGDEVWLPLLEAKQAAVDLETLEGITEVLVLYDRAEQDYLSIPVLRKHSEFLIDRYNYFVNLEAKPEELGDAFSVEWTRNALEQVAAKGSGHLTESHLVWDILRDWQLELLESSADKSSFVPYVEAMFLARLEQPHANLEETFQHYSTFTSAYKPPQDYEPLLVAASKLRSPAVDSYQKREAREIALARAEFTPQAYAYYINGERRPKRIDVPALSGLYERAIAEAAKRRFAGDAASEAALRSFWSGYIDVLRLGEADEEIQLSTFQRALRSVPGSGEAWARYFRFLERTSDTDDEGMDGRETIPDAFTRALSTNLLQSEVEQIVPITLARAGVDKRKVETGTADTEVFGSLVQVLEEGILLVRAASREGDPRFRLEKYLTEVYLKIEMIDSAVAVWKAAVKHTKSSYLAWTSYSDVLIKEGRHDDARALFKDICNKKLDWPEAVWEAWISFEHLHGTVHDIEDCLDRVEKAQGFLATKRAKDAEQAAYAAAQSGIEQQAAGISVLDSRAEAAMEVDDEPSVSLTSGGTKRKAREEEADAMNKRVKFEPPPQPLKRDRENCTVFVSDLPEGTSSEELTAIFKDCGSLRDIKITQVEQSLVATVEFNERDSVPAALTKDKKRIREQEIGVNLAWKSTLYVTNFPERTDDRAIKALFGKYGTLFDVRWPSKKFKSTRRFCYVQFTTPAAAEAALELNGRELDEGLSLNVYISNPERKKERTDADANAKEVYVAGLSKFATKEDLENLFKTYGPVKEVRMTLDKAGKSKGFAFVEFELEKDAIMALAANNYELKNRRLAVTLADTRVKPKNQNIQSDTGLGRLAEVQSRSLRIRDLPPGTQEGLLQQTLEQHAAVKRVEVYQEINEATVELENAAETGKILLRNEPIVFEGVNLRISQEEALPGIRKPGAPPTGAGGMFVPRKTAAPRPRAGLGSKKTGLRSATSNVAPPEPVPSASGSQRGQDDFRAMLQGKKP